MTTATAEPAATAPSDAGKAASAAAAAVAPATAAPAAAPAAPAAPVIPEKYDLKIPDGSPLDASDLAAIAEHAKAGKLTAEAAQKLVDDRHAAVTGFLAKRNEMAQQGRAQWLADMKADPEFGGAKLEASMAAAVALVEKFGPEMKADLEATGLGNYPPFVKFCARIAALGREDTAIVASPGAGERDAAKILFGSTTKPKP